MTTRERNGPERAPGSEHVMRDDAGLDINVTISGRTAIAEGWVEYEIDDIQPEADEPSLRFVRDYLVGIRHEAAEPAAIEQAGYDIVTTIFAGFVPELDPKRHYVRVQARDETEAETDVAKRLGWENPPLGNVTARLVSD